MNRKKRKLKFIRTKNYIRKGGILKQLVRISNEVTETDFQLTNVKYCRESAERRYKIPLKLVDLTMGMQMDDFAFNTKHMLIKFQKL